MKYIFILLAFISTSAIAQVDSTESPITVLMPKKGVKAFAFYISESPLALDSFRAVRKLPDYLASIIGSANNNDSIITITIKAKYLASFIGKLQAERNASVRDDYRSIMQNMPSIPGYTALQTQITTIANGNGAQKKAGQHVRAKFLEYDAILTDLWTGYLNSGYNWVKEQ